MLIWDFVGWGILIVDRKMLADVAVRDSKAFEVFVNEAKAVM